MTGLPVDYDAPAVKEAMKRLAKQGGQSRSDAKRAAARENLKKANAALRARRHGAPPAPVYNEIAQEGTDGHQG